MNILHISPYVPSVNTYHAGGVCMGKEIEALSKNNEVFILSFINDKKEENIVKKEYIDKKAKFVRSSILSKSVNAILNLNKPTFFSIRSSITFSYNLIKIVKKNNIDVIHAEYTSMGQYIWIKKFFPDIKFNLVEHDVTIQSYKRYEQEETNNNLKKIYRKWQSKLVYKKEKKYCQEADILFTLNEKDKRLLNQIYKRNDTLVITPYYGIDFERKIEKIEKIENSICFVGQMSRSENDLAAKRLIKIFKSFNTKKEYKLYIIGAHPSKELLSQANENIIVTGFVDVIEDYIRKCQIAVFPLEYGAGIKLKVLLSCGLGVPVITTKIGAEGIDEDGNVLILAEDDYDIKKNIIDLLENKKELEKKSIESFEFIKNNFNWKKTEILFDKLYY